MFEKNEKSMSMSDSMQSEMQNKNEKMMDSSMDEMEVTPKNNGIMPDCAIMGIIKNNILEIEEEIEEADKKFSRAYHNNRYSDEMYAADEKCKLLEAKRTVLVKVQNDIECMLAPMSV